MNEIGEVAQLELRNVTHRYNGKMVLDIPHLSIERGRIYGMVGPNGSGKTTLLSIMNLLIRPTTGQIFFEGNPIQYEDSSRLELRRSMAMTFQSPYLFRTSVEGNIAYGLRARGVPKRNRVLIIEDALQQAGLRGLGKRRARELSGGETQLVAIARALVIDPRILFLDEPTANVDARHIDQLEEVISGINRDRGTTIVLSTHNLSQAYKLAHHVFPLFEGRLAPSSMHNLFGGTIKASPDGPYFDTGKIRIWIPQEFSTSASNHLSVNPEDIIVSKEPFASSARNRYEGTITEVVDRGGRVDLVVNVGETFRVQITNHSFRRLELNVSARIYVTFKATSVHLL
ncbi:MAG: ATP-binding cassette domain-containing protein [Syntrophobacterales bacterium]|nr:MAG: ATP-binding cassette domain-containing protein [Syntrophobacterales bacterium]